MKHLDNEFFLVFLFYFTFFLFLGNQTEYRVRKQENAIVTMASKKKTNLTTNWFVQVPENIGLDHI